MANTTGTNKNINGDHKKEKKQILELSDEEDEGRQEKNSNNITEDNLKVNKIKKDV